MEMKSESDNESEMWKWIVKVKAIVKWKWSESEMKWSHSWKWKVEVKGESESESWKWKWMKNDISDSYRNETQKSISRKRHRGFRKIAKNQENQREISENYEKSMKKYCQLANKWKKCNH